MIPIANYNTKIPLPKTDLQIQYDQAAKNVLAIRSIQAHLLKEFVHEVKDYSVEEIETFIEQDSIEIGSHPLKRFIGGQNESIIPGEGMITYDIRYRVKVPNLLQPITVIVNVEAQKDTPSQYSLVSRAIFYCARLLSEQLDTEFEPPYYDNLKKVYSIWLNMNPGIQKENTIDKYYMVHEGNEEDRKHYDKLEIIFLNLGKNIPEEDGNLKKLDTIFVSELSIEEKAKSIKTMYNIDGKDMEDYSHMCNLSLGIEEKTRTEIIKNYIYKKFLSGASKEETKRDLREFFDLEPKEIENYISNFKH